MDAHILAAIPRRSRIIRSLGNSGGLLTQNALLVDVPSGWMVGYSYLGITSGLPVIRPQFRLTLDYTQSCRLALNAPKLQ